MTILSMKMIMFLMRQMLI